MAVDARIAVTLPQHPKTKKLIKRLGQAAAWNLVCLFLWAAANRSDGDLSGLSDEDIELAADWSGDDGAFVAALVEVRFLDEDSGGYLLHDWRDHNPWADGAALRSVKARWNAIKKHHGAAEADRQVPEYAAVRNAASNATSLHQVDDDHATSMLVADEQHASSYAPSPSPSTCQSPSPSPSPSQSKARAASEKQARTQPEPGVSQAPSIGPSPPQSAAGEVCKALRSAGVGSVNPSNPELLALLDKGVTLATFVDAATKAVAKRKGFGYLLGIVRGQLEDAADIAAGPAADAVRWDESRSSIETMGECTGVGRWCGNPVQELFSVYTERVRQAVEAQHEAEGA